MAKKINLRVIKGGFSPADKYAESQLRERGFAVGQVVQATITKLRSHSLHKHIHNIGTLCVNNIEGFENCDAHSAVKKIQLEGNIFCDEMKVNCGISKLPKPVINMIADALKIIGYQLDEDGLLKVRIPQSMSYDKMDEFQFQEFVEQICRHICDTYWPDMEPDQVAKMAEDVSNE